MKARWLTLLTVVLCCSACGAPSLRHKKEVGHLLAQGDFAAAEQKLEEEKGKQYKQRDALLYYLDMGTVLHDGGKPAQSDLLFAKAQQRTDELFTQSLTAHAGRYIINDLTVPYYPAPYEQALTYYYRAMNFLQQDDVADALVEANKAVFYLDHLPDVQNKPRLTSPFVQYFASLVFESAGKRDDARIARTRALQGYAALDGADGLPARPDFASSAVQNGGEVVLVHANGLLPLKISQTFQVSWGDVLFWMHSTQEDQEPSPALQNAIMTGLLGNSVTVAYPVLMPQPYRIRSSEAVTADGRVFPTVLMENVAAAQQADLQDNQTASFLRMALRAAAKRTAAVQARHMVAQSSDNESAGDLAGLIVSILGTVTEKADTRQWFTLPAQFRMTRFYVPAGVQDIVLRFKDGYGNIVEEHTVKDVCVPAGGRVYLHYRTAK